METNVLHINMKTQWPVGARDVLIQQQFVRYQDKAWISALSTNDDEVPEKVGLTRV